MKNAPSKKHVPFLLISMPSKKQNTNTPRTMTSNISCTINIPFLVVARNAGLLSFFIRTIKPVGKAKRIITRVIIAYQSRSMSKKLYTSDNNRHINVAISAEMRKILSAFIAVSTCQVSRYSICGTSSDNRRKE